MPSKRKEGEEKRKKGKKGERNASSVHDLPMTAYTYEDFVILERKGPCTIVHKGGGKRRKEGGKEKEEKKEKKRTHYRVTREMPDAGLLSIVEKSIRRKRERKGEEGEKWGE